MPGNRIGGLRATKTIVARYGVNEDGKSVLHVNAGRLGGLKSRGGGFAADPELASRAGKIGGSRPRKKRETAAPDDPKRSRWWPWHGTL